MYAAYYNQKYIVRAIDLALNKLQKPIDISRLTCEECSGKVILKPGSIRRPHFAHAKGNKFGDCSKNKTYKKYTHKDPLKIKQVIHKYKIIEIIGINLIKSQKISSN